MIREEIIIGRVSGRSVLDVGSVGQTNEYDLWGMIKRHAGSAVGIDTQASDDDRIVQGNMQDYDFSQEFDVIVMGDVIEHCDNQGALLDNARRHLKDDGVLILTTPNAKWFTVFLKPNETHTLWHDRHTLEHILRRHGFRIVEMRYYCGNKPRYGILKKLLALRQGIIAVCEKSQEL